MVAGVWLVFLAYPVVETFQADLSWVARGRPSVCWRRFAVVYLLGFRRLARGTRCGCGSRCWPCALATVPGIGIEAVGLTPYLGAFSALMVPAPWWRWTTAFSRGPAAGLAGRCVTSPRSSS